MKSNAGTVVEGTSDVLRRPGWLRSRVPDRAYLTTRSLLTDIGVDTVCREARCPNQNECLGSGLATFLILGTVCSRNCGFCNISHGKTRPPDPDEPTRVAEAVRRLKLDYVVITSVTRDDLEDGGAEHFVRTIDAVRKSAPQCRIELLIPDFNGSPQALEAVIAARPLVLGHNLETVPSLYRDIRSGADYRGSLKLLERVADSGTSLVKSGLMLGLGETDTEIRTVLSDLREADCQLITLGQYLPPSKSHRPVARFVSPGEFDRWKRLGLDLGFTRVESGPKVRSSYMAHTYASV
ncbi:lipoyl synthase [candidate division KSB1 bacterium]